MSRVHPSVYFEIIIIIQLFGDTHTQPGTHAHIQTYMHIYRVFNLKVDR
jgi:hypothetical protein